MAQVPSLDAVVNEMARQQVVARGRVAVKYALLALTPPWGHIVPEEVEVYIDQLTARISEPNNPPPGPGGVGGRSAPEGGER